MNDSILFASICLFIISFVGLATSLEFYWKKKESKDIFLILSWLLQLIRNILIIYALIMDFIEEFMLLVTIMGVLQYYFLDIMGITRYYHKINEKKAIGLLITFVVIATLVFLIAGNNTAAIINNFMVLCIQAYMVITPLFNFKEFKRKIGSGGKWYYITFISGALLIPVTIYSNSFGYDWGLTNSDSIFLIYFWYLLVLTAHIFLILFIVHMEYISINKKKDVLKDKYSHNLGNILQTIFGIEQLIESNISNETMEDIIEIFKNKLDEASKLIKEIRDL